MKNSTMFLLLALFNLSLMSVYARGGRGGGRGSIGSIFGTSRRKVFASSHSDRRKQPSSESRYRDDREHITRLKSNDIGKNAITTNQRQQNHYTPIMPIGGIYFRNHATIPARAVYIPHTPVYTSSSRSSDLINFFSGYMTGRVINKAIHNSQPTSKVYNKVESLAEDISNNDKVATYWPTDTDVPLSPFDKFLSEEDIYKSTTDSFFKRPLDNQNNNTSSLQVQEKKLMENLPEIVPEGGIICMPMIFNWTSENNGLQFEKLVCFPAPPPPPTNETGCFETKTLLFPGEFTLVTRHCNPAKKEKSDPVVGDILIPGKLEETKNQNEVVETEKEDI